MKNLQKEYIIDYKTIGGWFFRCDGSFMVKANNESDAAGVSRNIIDCATGGAKVISLELYLYKGVKSTT